MNSNEIFNHIDTLIDKLAHGGERLVPKLLIGIDIFHELAHHADRRYFNMSKLHSNPFAGHKYQSAWGEMDIVVSHHVVPDHISVDSRTLLDIYAEEALLGD